uniref:Uncharacterized protein n=1 Tax=Avena sativa TaxID=4498 RepID=A0ACD5XAW9_AVESA
MAMAAPSIRPVASVFGLLLLVFALSSTVIYLVSSSAPAAASPSSILPNLRPFATTRCTPAPPPLRVFMYDLPARFNVFMYDLQVELMDILWKSKYWQRSAGRDHVIPMQHPNAFRFLRDMVNASVLIVSDFGRYTKELASLRKDVVAPYVHVVDSFLNDDPSDPFEARPTLLFFRGRTVRKDEGKIRAELSKILKDKDGVRFEDGRARGNGIKTSTEGMRSSKFCLHPAGDTPSSCRLFDAIVSHCIPVIISGRIELPFEDEIDYSEFSLFFSVEEALRPDYLLNQLRQMPKEKWVEMWSKLKNVSSHYEFQYPPRKGDAVNMIWRQVKHKIPAVNLAIHRNKRLKILDWW